MSSTSTPNDSPNATPIQPMHNPSQAAHVVVPQAPLGNVANQAPGLGAKALLAKKMAKGKSVFAHKTTAARSHLYLSNPGGFVSPTDNMMTPVSQKLAAAKKKHFTKYVISLCVFGVSCSDPAFRSGPNPYSYLPRRRRRSTMKPSRMGHRPNQLM